MSRKTPQRRNVSHPAGSLLIVEGDSRLSEKLANEFRHRGYAVACADSLAQVLECDLDQIGFAVVDLWLPNDSGLDVVAEIKRRAPKIRVVVLTSHGSIDTAVQATKLGAAQYLTRPVDTDTIEQVLLAD